MKAARVCSLALLAFACAPLPPAGDITPTGNARTSAAISPADLTVRMYAFAHDSMMGREAGTDGGLKAARYLAAEMARLGLAPAGDGGSFYQLVPLSRRGYDEQRQISVDGHMALPIPTYNVVAKIRGSDAVLAGQYVAFGAHSDHVGVGPPVDHDSVRAYNMVFRRGGVGPPTAPVSPAGLERMRGILDSLRALRPARVDSIWNGADDDASGSVALLEIAEAFAAQRTKPRRSLIFVWHMAEEMGLVGADWFTRNPTIPLDSIITAIVVDMIGRGTLVDVSNGGGPRYLQVLGAGRRSTELDATVKSAAAKPEFSFNLDYTFDAPGHPERFYCRSDHYMYARFGIPVAYFHTGSHVDYHQVTDEPQYIDYDKLARVSSFMKALGETIANRDRPFILDKPKPDPNGPCRQ